jgi:hypothetical protein
MTNELHLYIDDSGSRDPDAVQPEKRRDGMDCFALGGILISEEDIDGLYAAHKGFCARWGIDYPLHSWAIRGGRGEFGWLKKPDNAHAFLSELDAFIIDLPILAIATVIDRPGYVARYKELHQDKLWFMCKTAYSILIERAAKYARSQGRQLRVFFEKCGKKEDRALVGYHKALKKEGLQFNPTNSGAYDPLSSADFKAIVLGDALRRTKNVPMIQIADLVLYAMAKGGYDPTYLPYARMMGAGKLIDAVLPPEDRAKLGIKYSCFPPMK